VHLGTSLTWTKSFNGFHLSNGTAVLVNPSDSNCSQDCVRGLTVLERFLIAELFRKVSRVENLLLEEHFIALPPLMLGPGS
jgi:hypothetical protein